MLDIILLHGITKEIDRNYYDAFVEGIRKHLPIDTDILWHPVDYACILAKKENTIYSWMKGMSWMKTRRFVCDFACDALAYGYPMREAREGDFIFDLHELIGREYAKCRKGSKIVIVGHSLGSVISYGLTWEFKTDCLITMGSPFLYFSVRYRDFGDMNSMLPQFHNFWRGRDPVSTIISRSHKFKCVHDYEVKSINPRYLFMLQSHSIYWRSKFVHKKIASILKAL